MLTLSNVNVRDIMMSKEVNKLKFYEKIKRLPWYKKIEVLRVINDWKQEEAAEKIGVDARVYWNWENGVSIPVKRNRERIAQVYGVSQKEIFTEIYKK